MTANPFQTNLSDDDLTLLSSYIDDQLPPAERESLEQRLQNEPALRAELEELHATTALLRDTPPLVPPRSFTLDPNQIYRRRPLLSGWIRLGSALAAVVLALTFTSMFIFYGQDMLGESAARMEPLAPAAQSLGPVETAAPAQQQGQAMSDTDAEVAQGDAREESQVAQGDAPEESAMISESTETFMAEERAETEEGRLPTEPDASTSAMATPQPTPFPAIVEPDGVTLGELATEEEADRIQPAYPPPGATVPDNLALSPLPQSPDTLGAHPRDPIILPAEPQPEAPGRSTRLPLVVITLLLVTLLAGAWYLWQRRSQR